LRRRCAPMPCAARHDERSRNSPRYARLRQPSASSRPGSAARRYAQGAPIQTKTGSLTLRKQDRFAILVGQSRRRARPERSQVLNFRSVAISTPRARLAAPVLGPVWSDEKHRSEGCPAHCAGADSCSRIAKAIRVLAASLRTEHRSGPARSAGA